MSKAGIRKGKRTAFLILVLLMCAVTVFPAFAQEEWENLQISLLYMDASGQEAQVDAVPVTWSGEQQAFWATVPDGIGAFTLRVQHPQHPDYVFMPGSGTMVSVMAGSDLAPETALVMTASDGNGTEIDHYALYVSLSPTPEETYEVLEREIPIICQTVDGKVLSMESVMISYGQTQIVQRPVIDGYEPVEDAPESLTVSVSQDGIPSQEMIIFVYSPIQPVTREIQVSYYLMDGTLLTLDTVMLQEGEQTLSRRNFEGYQGAEGTPDTITVTLYTDGTFTPENPAFYLQAIQTAPITKEIQVSYALTDGTLLATQAVTLQEGEQVLVRQEISGYAAAEGTPDTMTVTLYADGTVAPENPVFYLQAVQAAPITKEIQVSYVLADGTLLAAQAVTLQEGEQILARQEISGYAAAEGTLDTITVTLYADGTVVPENPSFLLQPVQTAPVQKEITVYWAADNMILAQEIYTIEAGTSITVERRTFDGYEPDSDTPEVITVSLNTDGTLTPSSPVFLYHAVYVPASREIQVTYVADGSTVLHSQIYTVTEGEPQTFQLLAFEGYVPDDGMPETVTVTVSADGTASALTVTVTVSGIPSSGT